MPRTGITDEKGKIEFVTKSNPMPVTGSDFIILLSSINTELKLLNERFEEAYDTGIEKTAIKDDL